MASTRGQTAELRLNAPLAEYQNFHLLIQALANHFRDRSADTLHYLSLRNYSKSLGETFEIERLTVKVLQASF